MSHILATSNQLQYNQIKTISSEAWVQILCKKNTTNIKWVSFYLIILSIGYPILRVSIGCQISLTYLNEKMARMWGSFYYLFIYLFFNLLNRWLLKIWLPKLPLKVNIKRWLFKNMNFLNYLLDEMAIKIFVSLCF